MMARRSTRSTAPVASTASKSKKSSTTTRVKKEPGTTHLNSPPSTPHSLPSSSPVRGRGSRPAGRQRHAAVMSTKTAGYQEAIKDESDEDEPRLPTPVSIKKEKYLELTDSESDINPRKFAKGSTKRKRTVKKEDDDSDFIAPADAEASASEEELEPLGAEEEEDEWEESKKKKAAASPKRKKAKTSSKQNQSKEAKEAKDAEAAVGQLAKVKARYAEESERRRKALETGKKSRSDTYGLSEGETPFQRWQHPTLEECEEVYTLLRKQHPEIKPEPKKVPEPSQFVAGCGNVPSILDALVRTRLSASTTNRNSSAAYRGMVERYGLATTGVGRGSVDYAAVRKAPVQDLYHAIKCGGLAVSKSADIKAILDLVYEENQERRQQLLDAGNSSSKNKRGKRGPKGADVENEEQKSAEIKLAENEAPSLDHHYALPTYDAIFKFMTYPGIGVKTAACVAMFCMQRPCFAVDTHVFRLAKWLGWVPPPSEKIKGDRPVDRDTTFSHLEVRVPDDKKHMLHRLFIRHGKTCPRCRGNTGPGSIGWKDGCPIDKLVTRSGPRKE